MGMGKSAVTSGTNSCVQWKVAFVDKIRTRNVRAKRNHIHFCMLWGVVVLGHPVQNSMSLAFAQPSAFCGVAQSFQRSR